LQYPLIVILIQSKEMLHEYQEVMNCRYWSTCRDESSLW